MKLIHNVYFTLKDPTDAGAAKLIASCKKYLNQQPGIEYFAAGAMAKNLNREVNDRDWNVALNLVFATPKHHDDYQVDSSHLRFIEENKETWATVRVFDAIVE